VYNQRFLEDRGRLESERSKTTRLDEEGRSTKEASLKGPGMAKGEGNRKCGDTWFSRKGERPMQPGGENKVKEN